MEQDFKDQIALVTGASRGLGRALAEALGARGAHVIALARTSGGLEEVADKIDAAGGSSTLVPLDITDDAGLQRMCLAIHERWGRLDLWCHTAAHATVLTPAPHVTVKDMDRSIAINYRAFQRLITMVDPLLAAAPAGQATLFADPKAGSALFGCYGASKAAADALAQSWQADTERLGPKVHVITPPPMATALRARFYPGEDKADLAQPREVAHTVLDQLRA